MKKLAAMLLLVFAFVQAGPVISSLFSDPGYVFVMDEENDNDKTETQKKFTKDFIAYIGISGEFSHITNTPFQLAEKIQLPPCLDNLNPPPNFS